MDKESNYTDDKEQMATRNPSAKWLFIGVMAFFFGYLGVSFYFMLWPYSTDIYIYVDNVVDACAGQHVVDQSRHVCGFLNPRNLIIVPVFSVSLLIVGFLLMLSNLSRDILRSDCK